MLPLDTLPSEQTINGDKQILANTDYNMLKAFEYVLQADSLEDLLFRIQYARETYTPELDLRKKCREEINAAEISLVQEQEERDQQMRQLFEAQELDS